MEGLGDIPDCLLDELLRARRKACDGNADAGELAEDKQRVTWRGPHVADAAPRDHRVLLTYSYGETVLREADVPDGVLSRELCC